MSRTINKWTDSEDTRLFSQVKAYPQNLSKCFIIVGEELGRSPKAVAAHWYTKVSKDPRFIGFVTVSSCHKSPNRKNGTGTPCTPSLFKRVLQLLKLI